MSDESVNPESQAAAAEDLVLLRDARAGRLEAYDELVRRYQGRIYGLVYNMTSHREDTLDLVQDIFVKAYNSLAGFRGQSSFYTWIYRIAINQTINFLKKRCRHNTLSLNDLDSAAERDPAYVELSAKDSPARDANLGELQEKMNKALQTLSEKHRAVVVMHDLQGLSHEEIAQTLGCSQGTVRSRLFYARQLLQNELTEFIK